MTFSCDVGGICMATWKMSDEELRQFTRRARTASPAARVAIRSAHVDEYRVLHVSLTGQGTLSLPARRIPGMRGAALDELRSVEIGPRGLWIEWPSRNIDIGIVGLITLLVGEDSLRRIGASLAGSRTSPAKAEAARRNGLKGGRPRAHPSAV
jgi:hypothetical protein